MSLAWVSGHDAVVADWAAKMFHGKLNFWAVHSAFGVAGNDGTLIGAALFSDYYPGGNVELTFVGPKTLTRAILNQISYHAFVTLQASRVTAKTRRSTPGVSKLLTKAGFRFECIQKRYFGPDDGDDAVVYSFPAEQGAKWIRKVKVDG